jgi:PIN domain nuclease of toxin-antitoxin system
MIFLIDTHIFVWFLDSNRKLSSKYKKILLNKKNTFVLSAIVLAEIKYLISVKRINIDFKSVLEYLSECDNCLVYPVDEVVIDYMPKGLDIHDALIVATGLAYQDSLGEEVFVLTQDNSIRNSGILPVA